MSIPRCQVPPTAVVAGATVPRQRLLSKGNRTDLHIHSTGKDIAYFYPEGDDSFI